MSTHSEQQPPLPGSAATSTPPIGNQSTITNILTPSPQNSTPPLSELLTYPPPSASTTPAAPKSSVPKARLLTSDESSAMLKGKEKAKKDALPEKERRKAEQLLRNSNEKNK